MTEAKYNPFRAAIQFMDRPHLEVNQGNNTYICHALGQLMFRHPEHQGLFMGAKWQVMRQIMPEHSFASWAYDNIPRVKEAWDNSRFPSGMIQFYREQLLEHLAQLYDDGQIDLTHITTQPMPVWKDYTCD